MPMPTDNASGIALPNTKTANEMDNKVKEYLDNLVHPIFAGYTSYRSPGEILDTLMTELVSSDLTEHP